MKQNIVPNLLFFPFSLFILFLCIVCFVSLYLPLFLFSFNVFFFSSCTNLCFIPTYLTILSLRTLQPDYLWFWIHIWFCHPSPSMSVPLRLFKKKKKNTAPPLYPPPPGCSVGTREGVTQKNLSGLLPVRELRLEPSLLYSLPLLALSPNLLIVWLFLSVAYLLAKLRCSWATTLSQLLFFFFWFFP